MCARMARRFYSGCDGPLASVTGGTALPSQVSACPPASPYAARYHPGRFARVRCRTRFDGSIPAFRSGAPRSPPDYPGRLHLNGEHLWRYCSRLPPYQRRSGAVGTVNFTFRSASARSSHAGSAAGPRSARETRPCLPRCGTLAAYIGVVYYPWCWMIAGEMQSPCPITAFG